MLTTFNFALSMIKKMLNPFDCVTTEKRFSEDISTKEVILLLDVDITILFQLQMLHK